MDGNELEMTISPLLEQFATNLLNLNAENVKNRGRQKWIDEKILMWAQLEMDENVSTPTKALRADA